ncbi:MAG: 3-hydroxyacyl-CoA dehydrogenase NAD-binding domain-containing protein [Acidaminococcaceae bacterium]|nr:3-hydroxyacyl-CoA dehydrogenase NAD-binding domain-containing protein [Acidaminococcaceae bacterium]MDD4722216.1 3-hydroxyacyl-CoA dehydrogenase NAD-binding domain-containing protein [Acidaminococcaceae bacterium]
MVKKLGVVGSGIMGRGIAHVAALNGFEVVMEDINMTFLDKAMALIEKELDKGIARGKTTQEEKNRTLENIKCTTKVENLSECEYIIEAAPEDLSIKLPLFAKLDEVCGSDTILASNTTSQSITKIAAATKRPDRVVGTHFFNPVHKMKLVELVRGLETSDKTLFTTIEIMQALKKELVQIKEFPGFVTSRMNAVIGNEAFNMLMEGLGTPEDIDKAIKLGLNHPMGPFEMIDLVGLDTRLKSLQYLYETLGEKYRPCPLHVQYVAAGRLGRKVGKGVYTYERE